MAFQFQLCFRAFDGLLDLHRSEFGPIQVQDMGFEFVMDLETWIKALITSVIGGLNLLNKGPDFRKGPSLMELNLGEFSLKRGPDKPIGSLHNLRSDFG